METIAPVTHDLGAFKVRRVLPTKGRTMVGPFIFVDEFGPAALETGEGMDVRPHPHINLATVTYLFEGADTDTVFQSASPALSCNWKVNLAVARKGGAKIPP